MASAKRETHTLTNDSIYFVGDWLEARITVPGDYIARVTCTCNRRVILAVELWLGTSLQSSTDEVFLPNSVAERDLPFTTISADTDVRVALVSVVGGNSNINLFIDSEVLTTGGGIPDNAAGAGGANRGGANRGVRRG